MFFNVKFILWSTMNHFISGSTKFYSFNDRTMKKSTTDAFHVNPLFWFLTSYAWPSINDFAVHLEIEEQLSESDQRNEINKKKRGHMLFHLLHRIPLSIYPWVCWIICMMKPNSETILDKFLKIEIIKTYDKYNIVRSHNVAPYNRKPNPLHRFQLLLHFIEKCHLQRARVIKCKSSVCAHVRR